MPYDVFLSYSSHDKEVADAACATLEDRGIRCWIAPRDIEPGVDWAAAIIDGISASRVFVLIYSASSNESPQVKREVERAVNRGIPLIPFRIENTPMSKALEYFISTPHWLDALTPPLQHHLDRLANTVGLILNPPAAPATPPTEHSSVASHPSARPVQASAGLARARTPRPTESTVHGPLVEQLLPAAGWGANVALVVASVLFIGILSQVKVGPIWLQPLAVLLVAAVLGSVRGGLATLLYIGFGVAGLPVFGDGRSAWTELSFRAPYVEHALGYLIGLVVAAVVVGWLAEQRGWGQHLPTAALLALVGVGIIYIPGLLWVEVAAQLLRESRSQSALLPSIPMLVITVGALAVILPLAWSWALRQARGRPEPDTAALQPDANA